MKARLTVLALVALATACNESNFKGKAEKIRPEVTREFVQDPYPEATTSHTQGHTGEPGTATFDQGEWGALDILVVVDTSGSMIEEQAKLSAKLEPLLSQVDKADWQIAVVTTDPADGCQRSLIKKADPNAKARFASAVQAGTGGTGEERLILQAVNGLKCQTSAWVRPGSTLVTLMLTDEDNCHIDVAKGYGCTGLPDKGGDFLTSYLSSIRTLGTDAKVYGLFWVPGTTCTDALKTADILDGVVTQSGGTSGSICDADYSKTLTAISNDVAQILKYEFEIGHDPDDGTLVITVDGAAWDKYTMEGRKVKFTEPPPFGSKVLVSYKYGKAGDLATAFPVDKEPVDGSFKVLVDGKEVPADGYKWNPQTKRLEFTTPPGERLPIQIIYKEQVALKDTFDIGLTADPKTITVFVNDAKKDFVHDAAAGTVKLTPAPPESAKIRVTFKDKQI